MDAYVDAGSPGTQTLRKALVVLTVMSNHAGRGLRLKELVELTGIERSTTHRLLQGLLADQFIERDAQAKTYALGIGALQLGLSARKRIPVSSNNVLLMRQLAHTTGHPVVLSARCGDESVCLHVEGDVSDGMNKFVYIGSRSLLGLGAASLAQMAMLEDNEIVRLLAQRPDAYLAGGSSPQEVWAQIHAARASGFGIVLDRYDRWTALGKATALRNKNQLGVTILSCHGKHQERDLEQLKSALSKIVDQLDATPSP